MARRPGSPVSRCALVPLPLISRSTQELLGRLPVALARSASAPLRRPAVEDDCVKVVRPSSLSSSVTGSPLPDATPSRGRLGADHLRLLPRRERHQLGSLARALHPSLRDLHLLRVSRSQRPRARVGGCAPPHDVRPRAELPRPRVPRAESTQARRRHRQRQRGARQVPRTAGGADARPSYATTASRCEFTTLSPIAHLHPTTVGRTLSSVL